MDRAERDQVLWTLAGKLVSGDMHACDKLLAELDAPAPRLIWRPIAGDFNEAYLTKVYSWWHEQHISGSLPSPVRIDPINLRGLLGNLLILDVLQDGADFRVRLYGSNVTPHSHHDTTGQKITEVWTPLRDYFLVNYRAVAKCGLPLYSLHTPPPDVNLAAWKRLILPFGEGRQVTRLLVGICPTERQKS